MGMYDEVAVPCPKCGEREFFQTKSGPCLLETFPLENCPDDVLENVNRHAPYVCEECLTAFSVDIDSRKSVLHNAEASGPGDKAGFAGPDGCHKIQEEKS